MSKRNRRPLPFPPAQPSAKRSTAVQPVIEIGEIVPSAPYQKYAVAGVRDVGYACEFTVTREEGALIGVAFPGLRSDGEIMVGIAVLATSTLDTQRVQSTFRRCESDIRLQVAAAFRNYIVANNLLSQ